MKNENNQGLNKHAPAGSMTVYPTLDDYAALRLPFRGVKRCQGDVA